MSDAPICVTQMISAGVIKSMTNYANMEKLKKTAVQVCLAAGLHLHMPHSVASWHMSIRLL